MKSKRVTCPYHEAAARVRTYMRPPAAALPPAITERYEKTQATRLTSADEGPAARLVAALFVMLNRDSLRP